MFKVKSIRNTLRKLRPQLAAFERSMTDAQRAPIIQTILKRNAEPSDAEVLKAFDAIAAATPADDNARQLELAAGKIAFMKARGISALAR